MQQHQNLAEHKVPSARLPTWHHDPSVASASVDLACLFCDVVARTVENHEEELMDYRFCLDRTVHTTGSFFLRRYHGMAAEANQLSMTIDEKHSWETDENRGT